MELGKDTLYTIECAGGIIGIDMEDHTNIERLKKMYDVFEKSEKEYKAKTILLEKKEDGKADKFGITAKQNEEIKVYNDYINGSTKAIDELFGKGASEKIFFDNILGRKVVTISRLEMFIMDLLPEHLEKANLKMENYMSERLKKRGKFNKEKSDVIDLDEETTE